MSGVFEFYIGKHTIQVRVPDELVTGSDALLFVERLRQMATGIETTVRLRDALANASRGVCGCPACTRKSEATN